MASPRVLRVEHDGDTLIMIPRSGLSELTYEEFTAAVEDLLADKQLPAFQNVVIDFFETDYFGSDILSVLLRVWRRVCSRHGKMAMCNVSRHETEILHLTRLDTLWPICSNRDEALRRIRT